MNELTHSKQLQGEASIITPLALAEKYHILRALELLRGNRTHCALALGIGIRTLQRKLIGWDLQEYLK